MFSVLSKSTWVACTKRSLSPRQDPIHLIYKIAYIYPRNPWYSTNLQQTNTFVYIYLQPDFLRLHSCFKTAKKQCLETMIKSMMSSTRTTESSCKHGQAMNSHVGPAVIPCLRFPVLWAQTDSQLEGCGEHHVGHHPQQTWKTGRGGDNRWEPQISVSLVLLQFFSVTMWWHCYTVLCLLTGSSYLVNPYNTGNKLIYISKYVILSLLTTTSWHIVNFKNRSAGLLLLWATERDILTL